jgi:demethylmenaquinone methyltransferase/2-methoxy-6-polyprenyl-1,4-benzoquinol methylase
MSGVSAGSNERVDTAIAMQRRYYDLRAPDYLNIAAPSSRRGTEVFGESRARTVVDELAPRGDVLELAPGPGGFTRELARHATTVTAVDASEPMLARNRAEVEAANVTYIQADLFDWQPSRTYDVVFFGFWLSHVPPARFDRFWAMVRRCVADNGRVAFVDEDDRGRDADEVRVVDGMPLARRALGDGQELDVIKLFWNADELTTRLRAIGWAFDIRLVGDVFMYGVGTPS